MPAAFVGQTLNLNALLVGKTCKNAVSSKARQGPLKAETRNWRTLTNNRYISTGNN